ncbi:hypothetical protein PROFUN_05602 [Planoprotostelium fungivorum]|uniref:Uncharacterized protein n=1 Tax=Planoprotostelium fungivorum TaxID=1890364 RepID=A0A2P6N082_9EUKA|nr:hypothetical protein PROFUN_05602 [Planoprotostelium fungivorum]
MESPPARTPDKPRLPPRTPGSGTKVEEARMLSNDAKQTGLHTLSTEASELRRYIESKTETMENERKELEQMNEDLRSALQKEKEQTKALKAQNDNLMHVFSQVAQSLASLNLVKEEKKDSKEEPEANYATHVETATKADVAPKYPVVQLKFGEESGTKDAIL